MNEEYNVSSVSSSIFYAKKNPPPKQNLLLSFYSESHISLKDMGQIIKEPTVEIKSQNIENLISNNIENSLNEKHDTIRGDSKEKKSDYKKITLSQFIPHLKEPQKAFSKKKPNKRTKKKGSPTKLMLTSALEASKKKIESKKKNNELKALPQVKKKQIIDLNNFLSEKIILIQNQQVPTINRSRFKSEVAIKSVAREELEKIYTEIDPFPFTRLTEWLIWHKNYPELAFVREVYDLEEVPIDSDEIFWVNIMNEPEFFNSGWKIAGARIEGVNSLKLKSQSELLPDWDIDQIFTDGFQIYFEDVYHLLQLHTDGIKNYRFPILLFALKGLLLLGLCYYDENKKRWFSNGSYEEMKNRLRDLDNYMSKQQTVQDYRDSIRVIKSFNNEWLYGIISFDLLVMKSLFMSSFYQNRIPEKLKIQILKEEKISDFINARFKDVEFVDKQRIQYLSRVFKY